VQQRERMRRSNCDSTDPLSPLPFLFPLSSFLFPRWLGCTTHSGKADRWSLVKLDEKDLEVRQAASEAFSNYDSSGKGVLSKDDYDAFYLSLVDKKLTDKSKENVFGTLDKNNDGTQRIASHRIASHRIASHRIASHDSMAWHGCRATRLDPLSPLGLCVSCSSPPKHLRDLVWPCFCTTLRYIVQARSNFLNISNGWLPSVR
jgi:hypothetical protein